MLLGLAVDTDASPWNCLKACRSDFVFAFHADSVGAVVNAMDGFFDCAEQF